MPHDHGHAHIDPESGDRRVAIAISANGLLTVAQIVGGILSGSLALIADAIHNFSDMASLVIAFGARKIARRPADARMTFGYGRVEIVAALIDYTSLILIGVYLLYEGVMRWIEPSEVAGWTVVILGCVALVVDTLTALLTYSMQKGSVNIRALFLHNLSDALASVAVIVGGDADPALRSLLGGPRHNDRDRRLHPLARADRDRRADPHPDAGQPTGCRHRRRDRGGAGRGGRIGGSPRPFLADGRARGCARRPRRRPE